MKFSLLDLLHLSDALEIAARDRVTSPDDAGLYRELAGRVDARRADLDKALEVAASDTTITKHTAACRMSFGKARPETGCPRCIELAAGAPARTWNTGRFSRQSDRDHAAACDRHFASARHTSGGCGPVCTFGDW